MGTALRQAYTTYPGSAQAGVVVVVGDLVIIGYTYGAAAPAAVTCTDNAVGGSNAYSEAKSQAGGDGLSSGHVFYAIAKSSETLTITCTAESDPGIAVHVVSGVAPPLAAVLTAVNSGTTASGTNHVSASVTPPNDQNYLFVLWFEESAPAALTENGTGFTEKIEVTSHQHSTYARNVLVAGTYNDAVTSAASVAFGNIIAAFKAEINYPAGSRGFNLQQMADAEDEGRFNELDVRNWWREALA